MKVPFLFSARWLLASAGAALFAASVHAQLVNDGATNTLSNQTNTFTGDVTVGTNGSFTLLVLSNNALLTNTVNGIIGRNLTAKSNEVRLITSTARWRMGGTLFIGSNGIASRLVVSNGALVESGSLTVGNHSASSNNEVIVTGPGSTLTVPGLMFVGADGNANRLTILNGGKVFVTNSGASAFVGFNPGRSNSALVADPGSRWSVNSTLVVGSGANANTLVVSNGAAVDSANGTIGSALTASNNLVIVTGSGSTWSNSSTLRVGDIGPGSQLIVSNGGSVFVGGIAYVGLNSFSTSNRVTVDGVGSLWQNPGELRVGSSGAGNRLDISNGGVVTSGLGIVGASSSNNVVSVTGAGSSWSNATSLIVGSNGANASLIVSNGGWAVSSNAFVGYATTASNNSVLVTGSGSVWSNRLNFILGNSSPNNQLTISDGGELISVTSKLGNLLSSSNNEAVVTGAGSVWNNSFEFYLGYSGGGNRLTIADGALVSVGENFFIRDSDSPNQLFVNGGTLRITNDRASAWLLTNWQLENQPPTTPVTLNSGLIEADAVFLFTGYQFDFNGGKLAARQINYELGTTTTEFLVVGKTGNIPAVLEVVPDALILINAVGAATPFPSKLPVAGLSGTITKVTVTLSGLAHYRPEDLDMLLVGPGGQRVMIMSDAGGSPQLTNATLVFDDAAPNFLPDSTAITNGSYRPTDYENTDVVGGLPRPYATALSAFNGTDPNGVWSLYIADDTTPLNGSLRRWSLEIQTTSGTTTNVFNQSAVAMRGLLTIGENVPGCQLLLTNPAAALDAGGLIVGTNTPSTNNRVVINGRLTVTDNNGTAVTEIRRGTNVLNAGFMLTDWLRITNSGGQFEFNGGTLLVRAITNSNGRVFAVGNGASAATLQLLGGTNVFSDALAIANNASLVGTGSIGGLVVVQAGGTLSPGTSIGSLSFNTTPTLQGTTLMKISKNGATRTNDQIQVSAPVTYGGALTVSNVGPTALSNGDKFKLFNATAYAGTFSSLTLPPLNSGLEWTNKLLADGSIEVAGAPKFTSIAASGTNVIITGTNGTTGGNYAVLTATNVTLPLSNWVSIATNPFNSGGGFTFTNGIAPGEFQRFFRLRSP